MKKVIFLICTAIIAYSSSAQDTLNLMTAPNQPIRGQYQYARYLRCNYYPFFDSSEYYACAKLCQTTPTTVYGVGIPLALNPDYAHPAIIAPAVIAKEHNGRYRATCGRFRPLRVFARKPIDLFAKYPVFPSCDTTDTSWATIGIHYMYFDSPITLPDTAFFGAIIRNTQRSYADDGGIVKLCSTCQFPSRIIDSHIFKYVDSTPDYPLYRSGLSSADHGFPFLLLTSPPPPPDTFSCPDIHDFTFLGLQAGIPAFAWSAADEHRQYEICYGPYDADPETLPRVTTTSGFLELAGPILNPDVYYQARCRAICEHFCHVHDTTLWTPWSEPQFFFVGEQMPDTSHADTATTSIYRTPARTLFSVSPNPARDEVSVTIDGNYHDAVISFRDSKGRELIRQRAAQQRTAVGTKHLPKGVYLVTVATKDASASQKLMIE